MVWDPIHSNTKRTEALIILTHACYLSKQAIFILSKVSADSSTPTLQLKDVFLEQQKLKDVFLYTKGELVLFQLWRSLFEGMKKD